METTTEERRNGEETFKYEVVRVRWNMPKCQERNGEKTGICRSFCISIKTVAGEGIVRAGRAVALAEKMPREISEKGISRRIHCSTGEHLNLRHDF